MGRIIKVAFDGSHKEILKIGNAGAHEWESWSQAETLIKDKGFEIFILKESPLTYSKLSEFDILVLGGPQTVFSEEEIADIVRFVKERGSLLAINEHGGDLRNNTNLSKITKNFGIEFNNDMVHDKINNIKGYAYGPIISDLEPCSSINFNIREFNLLLGCSLNAYGDAVVVARASKDSYVKVRNPDHKWEKKEIHSLPVLAKYQSSHSRGRVVAIGDSHVFSDDDAGIRLFNNKVLFNNIIDWLSEPFLEPDEKFDLLSNKINKISDDLVNLKKKLGVIETGSSVYSPKTYLSEQLVARINKLESLLKRFEKDAVEEEKRYYKTRVRLEIWAIIISIISVIVVLIVSTLPRSLF
ncbi:MAG: hypothetical protein ACTSO9_20720 [Candidatus Helarchaeota archaeon]